MQPGLVVKGMVANLVLSRSDACKGLSVLVEHGVLPDDEKGNGQIPLFEEMQHTGDQDVEIRGKRVPTRIPVCLHIGPLVIEVQRQAGYRFVRLHTLNLDW